MDKGNIFPLQNTRLRNKLLFAMINKVKTRKVEKKRAKENFITCLRNVKRYVDIDGMQYQ